jgi:hypothetical protein
MRVPMKRILIGFLLCASLTSLSSPSFAEINKWKDRDDVFFSSRPKIEIAKEKKPYSQINVTMYMTVW